MTLIPVNPSDFPLEPEPMDVGIHYKVQVTKLELSPKQDKNGNSYLQLETTVLEPETYAGMTLSRNYIAIPPTINGSMSEGDKRKALNMGVTLSRFCAAFGIRASEDGLDTSDAVGKMGNVIIEQGEYQGRKTFSIKDFLLS
jgi:hypothetical protein